MDSKTLEYFKNKLVKFRVCDVYIPDPHALLHELFSNEILTGEVIDLTRDGAQEQVFAIVKVEKMKDHLVIPAEKIIV